MSYLGVVLSIPLGTDGFTGNKNMTTVRPGQLIEGNNLSFAEGLLAKEGGATKYNAVAITGAPTILGGVDWWPVPTTQRMVVLTDDGDLLKDSGTTTFPVTLASGLTVAGVNPMFVSAGQEAAALARKLFVFTGENPVQVLSGDGATTADIAIPPADWTGPNQPSFGFAHEARLWGGGNDNDRHRLYWSTDDDHEDLVGTGAGSISVFPGEGERLVAGVSFKGLAICWKYPRGVYAIQTTDPDVANWRVDKLSSAIGGAGPNSYVLIDNDLLFMDATGSLHLISAVTEFGNVGSRNVSQLWDLDVWTRENADQGGLGSVQAIYYANKREAHFAVPKVGETVNTLRIVVDGNRLDLPRVRVSDRDRCPALWLRQDATGVPRPVIGDDVGLVWRLDQDSKMKEGVPLASRRLGYRGSFQTPHLDFSHVGPAFASKRKLGNFLELIHEDRNGTLTVDVIWDGRRMQTITFSMGTGGGAVLGTTFILGTATLGGGGLKTQRKRMIGSGRRLSLRGSSVAAEADFALAQAFAHVTVGDERTR